MEGYMQKLSAPPVRHCWKVFGKSLMPAFNLLCLSICSLMNIPGFLVRIQQVVLDSNISIRTYTFSL